MYENMLNYYLAPNLPQENHAFFGKNGGVSKGIYASLNFNRKSQDAPENIEKNIELVGKFYNLKADNVMRPAQAHTDKAVYVDKATRYQIEADGVVTDVKGIILGITTADCMPILLADTKHGVIGAAHAGWRGALSGVVENTIKVMIEHGAKVEDIAVAAGPCLQRESFEVKADMRDLFLAQDKDNSQFFIPNGDKTWLCDLEAYVWYRLNLIGIKNTSFSGVDTYTNPELYFSYRRNCHLGLISQPNDFPIELSTIRL